MAEIERQSGKAEIGIQEIVAGCTHYWIIEMPNGPTSQGLCKLCGDTKTFRNSEPEDRTPMKKGEFGKPKKPQVKLKSRN